MSLYSNIADMPGVIAAGEYAYRGDRYNFKGQLTDEMARMASIMCRATTMSTHMQSEILCANSDSCPFDPAQGWIVRGPVFTVCVMSNVFCFVENTPQFLNAVWRRMLEKMSDTQELI